MLVCGCAGVRSAWVLGRGFGPPSGLGRTLGYGAQIAIPREWGGGGGEGVLCCLIPHGMQEVAIQRVS